MNTWQSYKQERDCLVHFFRFLSVLARRAKCMRQPHTDFKSLFTHRLSNKLVLIWLLTTPPHLKYVATCTLPCNLSLMACFADINVSQGSVAIYARCDGIFNIHLRRCLSYRASAGGYLLIECRGVAALQMRSSQ